MTRDLREALGENDASRAQTLSNELGSSTTKAFVSPGRLVSKDASRRLHDLSFDCVTRCASDGLELRCTIRRLRRLHSPEVFGGAGSNEREKCLSDGWVRAKLRVGVALWRV